MGWLKGIMIYAIKAWFSERVLRLTQLRMV